MEVRELFAFRKQGLSHRVLQEQQSKPPEKAYGRIQGVHSSWSAYQLN